MSRNQPHYADPDAVADAAKEMTQAHLECRSLGHTWKPYTAEYDATARAYDAVLRCPRCKVRRVLLIDVRGHVVSTHYDYGDADGYMLKGMGRVVGEGKDALRLEQLGRFIGTATNLRRVN